MKINHTIIYALLIGFFTTLSSCKKFLDVTPVGQTAIPVLFSDMDGIRAAVPGAYAKTYDYYSNNFYLYPEIAGDLLNPTISTLSEGSANIYNFNSDPTDEAAPSAKIWSDILAALANVNNALFYIPSLQEKFKVNAAELEYYKAELLFLRALGHFDLCRAYAQPYNYTANAKHLGVPILLKTPSPDDNVSRQSVRDVYNFIIEDLKAAESILDANRSNIRTAQQQPFFGSKKAVQALLSRIYLYMENWDQAIYYATQVIANQQLATGGDYTDMFFNLTNPEKETIFRLNGQDKGSAVFTFFNFALNQGTFKIPTGLPANKFINSFDRENDIRKSSLMRLVNAESSDYLVTRKYDAVQTQLESNRQYINPLVLRLSEVYLNRAEAYIGKNESAKAAADIKEIQARALNMQTELITLPENDIDAMREIVYHERLRELAFEGHRLFDITRRKQPLIRDENSTSTIKTLPAQSDYYVLPIPQRELDANPNMQKNPTVNN